MQNLQHELIELLKTEDNLVIDGQLNKNKIIELGLKVEPQLIRLLIKNPTFKKHFFTEVESVLVFDKIKFQRFVNNKSFLPDSYTAFKNKIGLTINDDTTDNFIKTKNDVVLVWPHKDCVLEGGQTKEDQKRNEIFWNETLAPDNVDRLLDAKAFTNFKKYDKDGEHKITEFTGNENLILKGNNLLVLASLLKTHRGKIKLIYIDPPYNTEKGGFNYNDTFTHSTWLTFIKSRIEISKELLTEDGVIAINSDEIEHAYLKVISDEVFGRDNFKGDFIWQKRKGGGNDSYFLALDHDYILIYTKNGSKAIHNKWRISYNKDYLKRYKEIDDKGEKYYWDTLSRDGLQNPIVVSLKMPDGKTKTINSQKSKETIEEELKTGLVRIKEYRDDWSIQHRIYIPKDGKVARSILDKNGTNKTANDQLKELFGISPFKYPKPEELLLFLVDLFTNKNDVVLDFFVGSGTTAAVAQKTNRKYIGIEQMDYIKNVTVERLKKVIDGEQGGISTTINWQGGGSFIYAELLEYNQKYFAQIQEAKTKEVVLKIWGEMQEKAFLSYQFDKDIFNKRLDAFKTASLEMMQQYLVEIIDKNQLYVNFSEIEDKTFAVSKEDKALNYSFYKKNN